MECTVQVVKEGCFDGLDYVMGAVSNALSKEYRPMIEKAGAVYIDNSSAFRLEEDVPLVVPEINGDDALKNKGVIANPNCSTIITLMAVAAVHQNLSPITKMVATTFQAVSGAGAGGPIELHEEVIAIEKGEPVQPKVFSAQIAYNCIPQIGSMNDNGYSTEEMKLQNEGRKILHAPEMKVNCTCVRVPVYRSHSISATFVTERPVCVEEAEEAISRFPGVKLIKDGLPMPIDTSDQDIVYVGRIRRDLTDPNGLVLWCCGDQVRKGAAANAVQILEYIEAHK
jgi:aspartate-semialdehyde dehydrogenase